MAGRSQPSYELSHDKRALAPYYSSDNRQNRSELTSRLSPRSRQGRGPSEQSSRIRDVPPARDEGDLFRQTSRTYDVPPPMEERGLLEHSTQPYAAGARRQRGAWGTEVAAGPPATHRRLPSLLTVAALAVLATILVAIFVPVALTVKSKHKAASLGGDSNSGSASDPVSAPGDPQPGSVSSITGGDGSTTKTSNGTLLTYINKLGGIWYSDLDNPYNNSAYPNSWTKPLNQSWDFNNDRIYGKVLQSRTLKIQAIYRRLCSVNLGGWFVMEPFISPQLFQKYPGAIDEWSLSIAMAADTASGGLNQIEDHYKTFITEDDFAEIAGAGLNWVRMPIPYWTLDTWGNEPFLAKTSWKRVAPRISFLYIVQALQWARKYGLRVSLDLHTIPGSQNPDNHSGKQGPVNFLQGTMGIANSQRALNYIRIIAEFISQPEWQNVVPIFGIINEPVVNTTALRGFYVEAYKMLRDITGLGEGKGFYISIHDAFQLAEWADFMRGADRMIIDEHGYFAFGGGPALDPIDTGTGPSAGGPWPVKACTTWGSSMNISRNSFGVTVAGEWSNAINDCGLYVLGLSGIPTYGGNCADWQDSSNWTPGTKAGLMRFAAASMDTFRDWFFWTWKINPAASGIVESPLWSYQLGLRNGWMPTDPRTSLGTCGLPSGPLFNGFQAWQIGGAGAGVLSEAELDLYPYPPAALDDIIDPVQELPVYSWTGTISTLPVPTFTNTAGASFTTGGNGWFNGNDNAPAPTTIPGCPYPDPWNAQNISSPLGCSGSVVPPPISPPS